MPILTRRSSASCSMSVRRSMGLLCECKASNFAKVRFQLYMWVFAELHDEAEAAQVPAGQDRLRDGGHDGRGPGSCRPHPHTPTTGRSCVTSLVFLCDKSVYTDISYRESLVYLLLSNLFLDIRNTAQQICNRELVRQLLQTCIIAFSDTSLWQNYTAFWQTFFCKISLANNILTFFSRDWMYCTMYTMSVCSPGPPLGPATITHGGVLRSAVDPWQT